jgi:hypothetical protein
MRRSPAEILAGRSKAWRDLIYGERTPTYLFPPGTLVCLRSNTDYLGVVQEPTEYTRPGEVCVKWDDGGDLYNIDIARIEVA